MATAPRQRRAPTDATGAKRDQLVKEHEAELVRRQSELTMQQQVETSAANEIHDLTGGGELTMDVEDSDVELQSWTTVGEVPVQALSEGSDTVVIRINTDLEQVTIGHGNNFDFIEGQRYRVPIHVARHLEEKGYVWH